MKQNKKSKKNAAQTAATQETTVQAVSLTLDTKNTDSVRKRAAKIGQIDLFALHGADKVAKGYGETVMQAVKNRDAKADAAKARDAWFVVCGVASHVAILDSASGLYTRQDRRFGTLYGITSHLLALYGANFAQYNAESLKAACDAVKENTTLRLGKRELTGKVIASYEDKRVLVVTLDNGTLAVHTGELDRNSHQTTDDRASLVRGK